MANNNDSSNANVMRGDVTGYAFWAPLGTEYKPEMVKVRTVPAGFKPLGYIDSDGIVNSRSAESSEEQDMNGTTVTVLKTGYTETYQQKFMERTEETIKLNFGSSNVSKDTGTGIQTVKHNASFDANGFELLYRYISKETETAYEYTDEFVPNAKLKENGDVTKAGNSLYKLDATISALPDAKGNNAYEYTATVNKS